MSTVKAQNFQDLATGYNIGASYVVHGTAKMWCQYNTTTTTTASFNVSSLTDGGIGLTSINLTSAMDSATGYAAHNDQDAAGQGEAWPITASQIRTRARSTGGTLLDTGLVSASINGDLA